MGGAHEHENRASVLETARAFKEYLAKDKLVPTQEHYDDFLNPTSRERVHKYDTVKPHLDALAKQELQDRLEKKGWTGGRKPVFLHELKHAVHEYAEKTDGVDCDSKQHAHDDDHHDTHTSLTSKPADDE